MIYDTCMQLPSYFSSGGTFLLLPGPDVGFDGVLFDDGHMDMPLDNYVNFTFILLKVILLQIPLWFGIVISFEHVICWLNTYNFFVLDKTNRQKYFK